MVISRRSARTTGLLLHVILGIFAALCIIPLWAVISISFSGESSITSDGYALFPKAPSLLAYRYILKNPELIARSYLVSVGVTSIGTLLALLIISLVAFPLSRPDFRYRRPLTFYVFFTMLFNGGLVPWYILISRYLELKNTLLVMIIPYLVIPWFVLLLRTFFSQLPISLFESAKIDGATEFRSFFTILLPLSKPALATVGLFICLHYWNDWWLPLLYIEDEALAPLQYMLARMMANITFLTTQMTNTFISIDLSDLPNETARMAMCVLAAGPMLFVFPFFQKYFVRGLTAGSLKG